jgi:hypothetical protein
LVRVAALAILVILCCGCKSICTAAVDYEDVFITTGDLEQEYSPKALIEVRQSGLMIFGFIPVSTGTLQEACDRMTAEAKKVGADAVINLQYKVHKSPFPISFFWWKRGATVRGMAVKRKGK